MSTLQHNLDRLSADPLEPVRSLRDYEGLVGRYAYYREPPLLAAVVQVLRVGPLDSTSGAEPHREEYVDGSADGERRKEGRPSPLVSTDVIEVRFRVVAAHLMHERCQMQVGQICVMSRRGFSAGCLWWLQQTDRADAPVLGSVCKEQTQSDNDYAFSLW